jgi:small nuclear ribonucleoprotein
MDEAFLAASFPVSSEMFVSPLSSSFHHRSLFNRESNPGQKFEVNTQPPSQSKRPLSVLQKATNKQVSVRLKNEIEYKGKMSNVDPYMNVILVDAEESENGAKVANYGKVVIRGNNVLYVKIEDRL